MMTEEERLTPATRLNRRLTKTETGCDEWTGYRNSQGYGTIGVGLKTVKTHRLAWELANGPIPEGMCVLHQCDNPPCCNIEHLFLGTVQENNADRDGKGRGDPGTRQLVKTHCPQGHPYDSVNTYWTKKHARVCRACWNRNRIKPGTKNGATL